MTEASIHEAMAELARRRAPESLLPGVLQRVGVGYWYAPLSTVIGRVLVAHGPRGIVAVRQGEGGRAFEEWFARIHRATIRPEPSLPASLASLVEARLRGERRRLHVDLELATPFQRAVLEQTARIPYGQVRTYGWVAKEVGHPRAVRAVGTALAHNPVPLVIPCHRVLPGDLELGRYSCGGPEAKRAILEAEGVDLSRLQSLAAQRVRFVGSETTHVFCTPTCWTGRHLSPRHEVRFRSEREARQAGYRPCRVCRPVADAVA
jgi:O-6-methylguanine DNA methyltransferase